MERATTYNIEIGRTALKHIAFLSSLLSAPCPLFFCEQLAHSLSIFFAISPSPSWPPSLSHGESYHVRELPWKDSFKEYSLSIVFAISPLPPLSLSLGFFFFCEQLAIWHHSSTGMFNIIKSSSPSIKSHSSPFAALLIIRMLPFLSVSLAALNATTFSFNGFPPGADGKISCVQGSFFDGNAIQLTATDAIQGMGRCLYNAQIQFLDATQPLSFSTQFIFSISTGSEDQADGFAFVIAPTLAGVEGSSQGLLGLFNNETKGKNSTQTLAIEFDTYDNPEYQDEDSNHVGIDVNDIVSWASASATYRISNSTVVRSAADGYAVEMKGGPIQAWIDYDGRTNQLNISISRVLGSKPNYPLISNSSLNLSSILKDQMYVGFTASTGPLKGVLYYVHAWSFSNNGSSAAVSMPTGGGDSSKAIILGVVFTLCGVVLVGLGLAYVYCRRMRSGRSKQLGKDEWQVSLDQHLPQRFSYRELVKATHNFNEKNRLGSGGFGAVYQGVIPSSGVAVAVKRISKESKQGLKEFVSEVTTIGRLRHRNLVPLLGWCQEKGFMLIYELMPNGSLDKLLFEHQEKLTWNLRMQILKGVAAALLYLHEECEQKIVHRDVKASNVMLDAHMNARLGDFGLARLYGHDVAPSTTNVAGTWGYMAPESFFTRKATDKTDVFSFGALVLEVATGRKMGDHREKEDCCMLEWLWRLHRNGGLMEAVDPPMLREDDHIDMMMMVKVVLELGLLCCYPNPNGRPSMRRIVQVLDGDAPPPPLPSLDVSQPFLFSSLALSSALQESTTISNLSNDSDPMLLKHPLSVSLQVDSFSNDSNST